MVRFAPKNVFWLGAVLTVCAGAAFAGPAIAPAKRASTLASSRPALPETTPANLPQIQAPDSAETPAEEETQRSDRLPPRLEGLGQISMCCETGPSEVTSLGVGCVVLGVLVLGASVVASQFEKPVRRRRR